MEIEKRIFVFTAVFIFIAEAAVNDSSITLAVISTSVSTGAGIQPTSTTTVPTATAVISTSVSTGAGIQPTTATTVPTATAVPQSTPSVPANGQLQAVEMEILRMTAAEFDVKQTNFTRATLGEVNNYCANNAAQCSATSSRKRRAVVVFEVLSIVTGYPKQALGNVGKLLVAFFVTSSQGVILPKDTLFSVVTEAKANLSAVLGKEVGSVGRLHITLKTMPSPGSDTARTEFIIMFTGIFLGVVVFTAICLGVICWCGKKANSADDVRPLTTSALQLVEEPTRAQQAPR